MNVFETLVDKARSSYEKAQKAINYRFNKQEMADDEYWQKVKKDADNMLLMMADPRYSSMKSYIMAIKNQLDEDLERVAISDWTNYNREIRADKIAIVSAQRAIVKAILEYPDKLVDELRKRENEKAI